MAKVTLTQFSFNRGELDPALHGRSDWKYYYSGAEKLRNLVVRQQGGVVKRGGLRMIAHALDDGNPSHLIPFRFSVKQSYMLEFGDRRMRVIKDGGVVVYPAGHARAGEEVAVETPWPVECLPLLRHAQTADVMIFTHPDYPPRRLARHDHHDWRFSRLFSDASATVPVGLRVAVSGGDGARFVVTARLPAEGESPPSDSVTAAPEGGVEAPGKEALFSHLYLWQRRHDYSYVPESLAFDGMTPSAMIRFLVGCGYRDNGIRSGDSGQQWRHVKPDGKYEETVPWWGTDYNYLVKECLYACDMGWAGNVVETLRESMDRYVADYNAGLPRTRATTLAWNAVTGAELYRIYRERTRDGENGYRLIGETSATVFTDDNTPPRATGIPEPVDLFSGVGDYPGVCAFFEQRLILGRTDNRPTTFWGSNIGQYNAFTRHSPIEDSDSYEFTLSSGEMNGIQWIVPLNDMLLGTSGGEWKAGGGGSAITPSNINARVQSWYGCSHLAPVVVGRTVLFAGRSRRTIRNFSYSLDVDGYTGRDLTAYANHLFAGREIVGMCHQQEPSGIVWVVMSDGALLSCTYAVEEDVVAWSRHETEGRFESCGSLVDADGSDQIYFCVAREVGGVTRRFIEALSDAADAVANESDGFFLDCGLTYRGAPVGRVSGLEHLEGERVSCLADGSVFTDLPVEDGAVELPDGFVASVIHAGIPYVAEAVTMELEPESDDTLRNRSRFAVAAAIRLSKSRECLYSHSDGALSEMKFRTTEPPGRPVRLFTGEKYIAFSTPPGARTTRLRFVSGAPTSFALLGIVAEASCGQPA